MTLKELENAVKTDAELSLNDIAEVVKNNIEFSFTKDKINIKGVILDEDDFKNYMKHHANGTFEKALIEYISMGLNYEYTPEDLINVTLK